VEGAEDVIKKLAWETEKMARHYGVFQKMFCDEDFGFDAREDLVLRESM
jgi:hypothetical protein